MNIQFTHHAREERINGRLKHLVTIEECYEAIYNELKTNPDAEFIKVKKFDRRQYIDEGKGIDNPKGDLIAAAIAREGNCFKVKTIMLVKSTNPKYQ